MNLIKRLIKEDEGVTALEYGLIAALIAVVIILAVAFLGTRVSNTFSNVGNHMK